ncbi:MAG: ThiF family adenylyltransferase [Candidatus Thermoplasmatota archaeon]
MVEARHTDDLPEISDADFPPRVREAVASLRTAYPTAGIRTFSIGDDFVKVALDVEVNLPSRGSRYGIRRVEPITLTIHRRMFPHKAPFANSNRLDFPTGLPHLNPVGKGSPASFCLHRGKLDDWYAEHSIEDLVERTRGWLRDAAAGNLIRAEDEFEGTLVAENLAYAIYDAKAIDDEIRRRGSKPGHLAATFRFLTDRSKVAHLGKDAVALQHEATVEIGKAPHLPRAKPGTLVVGGLVAWPDLTRRNDSAFGTLPTKLDEVADWAQSVGIDLRGALDTHVKAGIARDVAIPLILVVPRGRKVIGTMLTNEYLTFLLVTCGDHTPPEGGWKDDAPVYRMSHRKPMTTATARELSTLRRDTPTQKTLLLGAGALGSKISLHLARRGETDQTIVDHDTIEPHNFVRHALLPDSLGQRKAEALVKAVSGIIPDASPARHVDANVLEYLASTPRSDLASHKQILDATAAPAVFEALLEPTFGLTPVRRFELADEGRLGIVLSEGRSRDPRIDDLQAKMRDLAIDDDAISHWLVGDQARADTPLREQIHLGMSCSSDTLRLPDDVVSHHAAAMSTFLRCRASAAAKGVLQLSWTDPSGEDAGATRLQRIELGPTTVRAAENDPSWKVRFLAGTQEQMLTALRDHKPRETGGILIGFAHRKRRITYVTRVLAAPPDSHGSPLHFVRGTRGLADTVARAERRTGGLMGYLGDWHTHPKGGHWPSGTDLATKDKFLPENQREGMPTMIVIATPGRVTPYVYT